MIEDCLAKMVKFVKTHNLQPMFGKDLNEEELEYILGPQAKIASQLPLKLDNIDRELLMQLTVMSLYDFAILIGGFLLLVTLT